MEFSRKKECGRPLNSKSIGAALPCGRCFGAIIALGTPDFITPQPTPTPAPTPTPTPTPTANPTAQPTQTTTNTPTPHPTATTTPQPSPTPNNSSVIKAITDQGTHIELSITGNITSTQISNATVTTNQTMSKTTIAFTLTGQTGTVGFANITIPKSAVPQGTNPTVFIDNQLCTTQGYTQDSTNYYVWYTAHFSSHQLSIMFEDIPLATATPTRSELSPMIIIYGCVIGLIVSLSVIGTIRLLVRNKQRKKAN